MKQKSIMLQGTASDVGKSVLCAALCRIFMQDGYRVNPFKAQNMALNSYTTIDGHEIGRAQAMQAEACHQKANFRMNPLLLKPTSDHRSQIILNGQAIETIDAAEFYQKKESYRSSIINAYHELEKESDIVVLEGAGSPAEINLIKHDLVNMSMAKASNSPVLLVADIDRGGVFASIYGTVALIPPEDRARIKGIIINKFRGDIRLLQDGIDQIEELTNIPVLGVIPYIKIQLEDEDSMVNLEKFTRNPPDAEIDVVAICLPYMSNFTDIAPLSMEPRIRFRFIQPENVLGTPDLIILPGTKNTIEAARTLQKSGMSDQIHRAYQHGSSIFGICGGFQLLGKRLLDPEHLESNYNETEGLGLLDIDTKFGHEKYTGLVHTKDHLFQLPITGYELHHGYSIYGSNIKEFTNINGRLDGAIAHNGRVVGTYLHGIFEKGIFTRSYINHVRSLHNVSPYNGHFIDYPHFKEEQYNLLADHIRKHLNMEQIYHILQDENI